MKPGMGSRGGRREPSKWSTREKRLKASIVGDRTVRLQDDSVMSDVLCSYVSWMVDGQKVSYL